MRKVNSDIIRKIDQSLLRCLRAEDCSEEHIQLITTKNDLPTLQFLKEGRPIFLHSKYNPIQEAERIVDNLGDIDDYEHIFFYGVGLGYHVEELLKRYPEKRFTLVEPSKDVFKYYLEQKEMTKLPVEQLSFLKVGLTEKETLTFLLEFFNFIQEKTLLVTLPSYERYIPEQYKKFVLDFKKIIEEKRQGILVNYSFQKRWVLNSWINLPQTLNTPNILHDIDKDRFKNKPAILVAAGPSLNDELGNLRFIKENQLAYIFSVGSSINTLVENDIYPDAMCTYDPTVMNQRVFQKVNEKGIDTIPMVYGTSVGFETLKNYQGPKLHMITSQDTISNYYIRRSDDKEINKVNDAPSIAVVTLELLYKLGCSPIILVGQNLAYKDKQTYAKDMGYDHVSNELTEKEVERAIRIKSVEGNEILTDQAFNRMRSQIEYYLTKFVGDVDVFNTTKGGAQIKGTTFIDLQSLINERIMHNQIEKEWYVTKGNGYDLDYTKTKRHQMIKQLDALTESLRKVKRLFNKIEHLIIERKIVKLEQTFKKFDVEMKKVVKNDFYLTFLQPMSRVEFDLLTKDINALKFDKDTISKAKKTLKSFKRFVNSCEFDLKNLKATFEEVNNEIMNYLNESNEKDVIDGK